MSPADVAQLCIDNYVEVLAIALPVSVTIGLVNMVLNMLLSAFFGGKLQIGGKW